LVPINRRYPDDSGRGRSSSKRDVGIDDGVAVAMNILAFKVGDVVVLKSGGPHMHLEEITTEGLLCTWKDGRGTTHEGIFDAFRLEHMAAEPTS
jgi:uncharacterized protein YodC (DUF2158 family)